MTVPTRITAQFGQLLAADATSRTIAGLILPFGEVGYTSAGPTLFNAESVTIAPDLILNLEHDGARPIGRAIATHTDTSGVTGTFKVAHTTAGNDALIEAADGLRPGLSVEADVLDAELDTDGTLRILAAHITGVGLVTRPAFSAALVERVAANEHKETDDMTDPATAPDPDLDLEDETEQETDEMTDDSLEATERAVTASVPRAAAPRPATPADVFARLTAARATGDMATITAALADVTYTANAFTSGPAWLGQVWEDTYAREIVPLVTTARLTSPTAAGWRWKTKPDMGDYAGDKAAIPSAAIATEAVTVTAQRVAVGHDIDRIFLDFPNEDLIAAYWREVANSYAYYTDGYVADELLTHATPITGAAADLTTLIIKGITQVKSHTGRNVTSILVGVDAYTDYMKLSNLNAPAREVGPEIRLSAELGAKEVLMFNRGAFTFYELGPTPLRADVINVAKGGVDLGAFGYIASIVGGPNAIVKGTIGQAATMTK